MDTQVRELIAGVVKQFNQYFNPVEQIKQFELLPSPWTIEGGELTPTLKLKRKIILEKYQDKITCIYNQINN